MSAADRHQLEDIGRHHDVLFGRLIGVDEELGPTRDELESQDEAALRHLRARVDRENVDAHERDTKGFDLGEE